MGETYGKLSVFFEDPFWVGVFERITDGKLSVCKVTFGSEPKDYEVWDFVLKHYSDLEFSPAVETDVKRIPDNPKPGREKQKNCFKITALGQSPSRHCKCSGKR